MRGQDPPGYSKISDEELLIRIFKVRWAYIRKKRIRLRKKFYENARLFIHAVGKEGTDTEAFIIIAVTIAQRTGVGGNRPRFSPYTSGYEADDTGAIYLPSLKRALQGTPWQYCALRQFYEPTKEAMQVSTYLRVYRRHPKLIEHLVKVGFDASFQTLCIGTVWEQKLMPHKKRITPHFTGQQRRFDHAAELNAGIDTLRAYQQYTKLNLQSARNFYSGSSKIMCIRFQRSGLPI